MSDKEKFEAKKNGQDIDEGVAIVLQNTDWAKAKSQEETSVEASAPIESDKLISEVIPTDSKEAKQTEKPPVFEQKEDTTFIAPPILETQNEQKDFSTEIDFDKIAASLTSSNVDEVNQADNGISTSGNFDSGSVGSFENQTPTYEASHVSAFETSSSDKVNGYNNDYSLNQMNNFGNKYDDLANDVELEKVADVVSSVEDAKRLNQATNEAIIKVVNESFKKIKSAMSMLEEADALLAASEENTPGKRWYDKEVAWRRNYRGLKERSKEESYSSSSVTPFTQEYNDNVIRFSGSNDDMDNNKPFAA